MTIETIANIVQEAGFETIDRCIAEKIHLKDKCSFANTEMYGHFLLHIATNSTASCEIHSLAQSLKKYMSLMPL